MPAPGRDARRNPPRHTLIQLIEVFFWYSGPAILQSFLHFLNIVFACPIKVWLPILEYSFEHPPDVLDRVQVRGVRRPFYDDYTPKSKQFAYTMGSMDRGIVLHENVPIVV
jgi:hypothetical protein